MEKMIDEAGVELIEKVRVAKGKLVRWVNVCE
jgi:hypothetical protein